jgi:hypothetical protein
MGSTPTPKFVRHLGLTFAAEKPPPVHVFETVALAAAEESGEYELRLDGRRRRLGCFGRRSGRLIACPGPRASKRQLLDSCLTPDNALLVAGGVDDERDAERSGPSKKRNFLSITLSRARKATD